MRLQQRPGSLLLGFTAAAGLTGLGMWSSMWTTSDAPGAFAVPSSSLGGKGSHRVRSFRRAERPSVPGSAFQRDASSSKVFGRAAASQTGARLRSAAQLVLGLLVGLGVGAAPAFALFGPPAFTILGRGAAELFPVLYINLLSWTMLLFAPTWRRTKQVVLASVTVHLALFAAVMLQLVRHFFRSGAHDFLGFLACAPSRFRTADGVFAGFLHYSAANLLLGLWTVSDAQRTELDRSPFLLPLLLLTMLFGPLGTIFYLLLRQVAVSKERRRQAPTKPAMDETLMTVAEALADTNPALKFAKDMWKLLDKSKEK